MIKYCSAPGLIHIEITSKCNMRCPQCYNLDSGKDIDSSVLFETIKEASSLGVEYIALSGGEPLLYPGIFNVLKTIRKHGMTSWIATGGKGLSVEIIDHLIDSGLDCLFLSLNGSTKEIHETSRSGYDDTFAALGKLKESALAYEINWVARNDNVVDFSNLAKMCTAYNARAINVLILKPDMNHELNNSLSQDQLFMLADQITNLKQAGFNINVEPCFAQLRSLLSWNEGRDITGCLAGTYLMAVNVDGKKMPCRHLQHYADGNRKNIMSYWNHSEVLKKLRNMDETIKTPCSECFRLKECIPCRAIADKVYGSLESGEPNCTLFNVQCD